MKRINIRIFGVYFLLAIGAIPVSCKKILDRDVIQTPTTINAIKTPADVEKAVAGAYSLARGFLPRFLFQNADVRGNNFYNGGVASQRDNLKGSLDNDWTSFYRVIAQCNLIIQKVDDIPASSWAAGQKERFLGEASFMRGLIYFILVRAWGDVPLVLKNPDLNNAPRELVTNIYPVIENDLNIAATNLLASYGGEDKAVRATKGAALAILAHVQGWQRKYADCEKTCEKVINSGEYAMIKDSVNLIRLFVGKSDESIFEFNFEAAKSELVYNDMAARTMGLPYYTANTVNGAPTFVLTPPAAEKLKLFPNGARDIRRDVWFVKDTWPGTAAFFGKYRTFKTGATRADTASQNINESNVIVTRLPDIILLRAEALATLGRTGEAVTELNKVRDRAKTKLYAGNGLVLDTVLFERRKELIGEGHYLYDLVRTRLMNKYHPSINQSNFYELGNWLLPINPSIIQLSNYVITQNSWWETH